MLSEAGVTSNPGRPASVAGRAAGPGRRAGACSRLTIPQGARNASPDSITNHAAASPGAVGCLVIRIGGAFSGIVAESSRSGELSVRGRQVRSSVITVPGMITEHRTGPDLGDLP